MTALKFTPMMLIGHYALIITSGDIIVFVEPYCHFLPKTFPIGQLNWNALALKYSLLRDGPDQGARTESLLPWSTTRYLRLSLFRPGAIIVKTFPWVGPRQFCVCLGLWVPWLGLWGLPRSVRGTPQQHGGRPRRFHRCFFCQRGWAWFVKCYFVSINASAIVM